MATSEDDINIPGATEGAKVPSPGAFSKYDKIPGSSGKVGAAAITAALDQYIVTEKVHGANFCIIVSKQEDADELDVKFARRTAIIGGPEDAEDFFSARSCGLLRRLAPRARRVLEQLLAATSAASSAAADAATEAICAVHIYGELFGGEYPHPDVPEEPKMRPVQKGVWYSPKLEFMGFDVVQEGPAGVRRPLDFHTARKLCESCEIMFAKPLLEGTLAECLDFDYLFVTTMPGRLGFPPLPESDEPNHAEGVVIRPRHEPSHRSFGGRSSGKDGHRGLFKRKIEAFSEKKYQYDDWKAGKAGGAGTETMSEEEIAWVEVQACVTEQRLAAVISKIGRIDPTDKPAIIALLAALEADVREDLAEDDLAKLNESKELKARLQQACKDLINQEFKCRLSSKKAAIPRAS
eukprot:CAMPEP_0194756404 /NCGR_PEP_ID=MMETSP0323_2-20130528/10104_1 /TAXON_ID=2866 ORGANISM="Crypthecodinium cohnii, Strain Seligo" /NCGR_SAMPLE_ID=MMETSP0323_2 /ASSEMBLY_ACC=CAM_ASM_000346 /LENGTH=407 /DNA_ID=CAMNT_0039675893 /DNA_START=38 /DNA_END=1261 /DNA_ORIENTATION=+